MTPETLREILTARADGRTPVWITPVPANGEPVRHPAEGIIYPLEGASRSEAALSSLPAVMEASAQATREDRTITFEVGDSEYLARPFNPPARLIIVGAVHVAQALVPMASQAGLRVAILDPRPAWINEFRFPDVQRIRAWPDEGFAELKPDHRTAVVTLTHDPKVDDPALLAALESPAFYIGALGSRRTHAKRVVRLEEAGATSDDVARIHSPVGLDIGARGPDEIAVAVLAQVIQVLRTPPTP